MKGGNRAFAFSNSRFAAGFNEAALHEGRKSPYFTRSALAERASMRPPFMKGGNRAKK